MIWDMPNYIAYYTAIKTKPIIIFLYDRYLQECLKNLYINYENWL